MARHRRGNHRVIKLLLQQRQLHQRILVIGGTLCLFKRGAEIFLGQTRRHFLAFFGNLQIGPCGANLLGQCAGVKLHQNIAFFYVTSLFAADFDNLT